MTSHVVRTRTISRAGLILSSPIPSATKEIYYYYYYYLQMAIPFRIDRANTSERSNRSEQLDGTSVAIEPMFFFLGLFDTRLFEFKSLTFFFLSFCQVWSAPSFSFLRRIINPRINQTDERHTHTHEKKNRIQNREQKVARLVRVHHEFHSVTEQEKKKIRKKIVFRPSSDEFSLALGCLFFFK